MVQSVKRLTWAQVMIWQFGDSSTASGSVLTAQSLEPALDSVSPSLPLPRSCSVFVSLSLSFSLSLSQKQINIQTIFLIKKKKTFNVLKNGNNFSAPLRYKPF